MKVSKKLPRVLITFCAALALITGISILSPTRTKADDLPVQHVSGTLLSSQTWTPDKVYVVNNALYIPEGITLTIQAGTIVKLNNSDTNHGIRIATGGVLDVNGQSSLPVIFTSLYDDTYGGDSNNNGASSGNYGDYTRAINLRGGTANIDHAVIQYAPVGIYASCSSNGVLTVADSSLRSKTELYNCSENAVSMQRNEFNTVDDYAIYASHSVLTGISLAGSDQNMLLGTGKARTISLVSSSGNVPSGDEWTISGTSQAILLFDNAYDRVINGTLNLEEGAVIKSGSSIVVRGVLNVSGTSTSPVIFTSYKDDSVGGDSNGDGLSSGQINDFSSSIRSMSGSVTEVTHAIFRYSDSAIGGGDYSNSYCSGGAVTVTDSIFNSNVAFSGCGSYGPLTLERNQFDMSHEPAIKAGHLNPAGISLSGANKNSFTGSGIGRTIELATGTGGTNTIPTNTNWTISGSSGAVIVLQGYLEVSGTLQFEDGAIVKSGYGLKIKDNGMLDAEGSSNPVIFTSYKDDSAGGDSNNDGSSAGSPGDYGTAISLEGGDARLDGVIVKFGTIGIMASGNAVAIVRGNIEEISNRAIQACGWGQGCSVDAAYVDWGSSNGPFVINGQDLVCGSVTVSPWIVGSSTATGDMFGVENCDSSPTPAQVLATSATNAHEEVADARIDCDNGIQDACDAIQDYLACFGAAIQLASSQSPIPVTFDNPTETVDTVASTTANAANTYIQGLEFETVGGFNMNVATGILNVVNLYNSLSSAYNTCSP